MCMSSVTKSGHMHHHIAVTWPIAGRYVVHRCIILLIKLTAASLGQHEILRSLIYLPLVSSVYSDKLAGNGIYFLIVRQFIDLSKHPVLRNSQM